MKHVLKELGLQDSPGEIVIKQALKVAIKQELLSPEQFGEWREKMQMTRGEARKLGRISKDWRIIQAAHRMPEDVNVLYELTQIGSIVFDEALKAKLIRPTMTLEEAKALK